MISIVALLLLVCASVDAGRLTLLNKSSVNPRQNYRSCPQSVAKQMVKKSMPCDRFRPTCGTPQYQTHVDKTSAPFTLYGFKNSVQSLSNIMQEIKSTLPGHYASLGSAGMLCCRCIRFSGKCSSSWSNHAFGSAIDLKIDGKLDVWGDGKVYQGLLDLYPIFAKHGWYWGIAFRKEDSMHFEVSRELAQKWINGGAVVNQPPPQMMFVDEAEGKLMCFNQNVNARVNTNGGRRVFTVPIGSRLTSISESIKGTKYNYFKFGVHHDNPALDVDAVYCASNGQWITPCENQNQEQHLVLAGWTPDPTPDTDNCDNAEDADECDSDNNSDGVRPTERKGTVMCFTATVNVRDKPYGNKITLFRNNARAVAVDGPKKVGSFDWYQFFYQEKPVWVATNGRWYRPCADQTAPADFPALAVDEEYNDLADDKELPSSASTLGAAIALVFAVVLF